MRWLIPLLALVGLAGCPTSGDPLDGGAADRGGPAADAGVPDPRPDAAPPNDAAPRDASPGDAARPDAGSPEDAGAPDAMEPDGAPPPPPPETALPVLFDGQGGPVDGALAALVYEGWRARPTDEAGAQAQARAVEGARRTLVDAGEAAADRVVAKCRPVPVDRIGDVMVCLRLLSLVESPASLDFLLERALLPIPAWPEGAHPTEPAPEALGRDVATWALGQRARLGSAGALDRLLRAVATGDDAARSQAVAAVFAALPRVRAKARLRAVLPAAEHYRLYERR